MHRVPQFHASLRMLDLLAASVISIVLYPRAKWLVAFVLVGFALLLNLLTSKRYDTTSQDVADRAESFLTAVRETGAIQTNLPPQGAAGLDSQSVGPVLS
jgi:hypothetical protein